MAPTIIEPHVSYLGIRLTNVINIEIINPIMDNLDAIDMAALYAP